MSNGRTSRVRKMVKYPGYARTGGGVVMFKIRIDRRIRTKSERNILLVSRPTLVEITMIVK